jgi:hypothetical protein
MKHNSKGLSETLRKAAAAGDPFRVLTWLEAGADPNTRDDNGMTALHHAALGGNSACVRFLLKYTDKDFLQDNLWRTPLHYAAMSQTVKPRGWNEERSKIIDSLVDAGLYVNDRDREGRTPLHYAAIHGTPKMTRRLRCKGADADAVDRFGFTPKSLAQHHDVHRNLAALLEEEGDFASRAEPKSRVARRNTARLTAKRNRARAASLG